MRRLLYAGLCLAFIAGTALILLGPGERLAELDGAHLARNEAAWRAKGIDTYTIEVQKTVDSMAPETILTSVERGEAKSLSINGHAVAAKSSYGVEGLFTIAGEELEMQKAGKRADGQPGASRLRALFHAELGFPLVIKRVATDGRSFVLRTRSLRGPTGEVLWQVRP